MKARVILFLFLAVLMGCSVDNILSYDEQLKKDTAIINKYLEKNNIVTVKDTSGLQLVIHNPGSGLFPVPISILTVKYTGKFLNGQVFAQNRTTAAGLPESMRTSQGVPIPLSDLIPGWQYAFYRYIAKGGKATLYIPSGLGYKRTGDGSRVPANANLIFEIELVSFTNN